MKFFIINDDGGSMVIQALNLESACEIADEGGINIVDIAEVKFYQSDGDEAPFFNREKGRWYAVDPYTEETLASADTLEKLKMNL